MRWPWATRQSPREIEEARSNADADLDAARQLRLGAREVSSSLRDLREANHFAEALAATYRRRNTA